ncbi:S8 family peptidase [Pontibacter sp. E15-1]|uniref:S8/S53 family peptidase n=1 Tax=Pontibacter sp. E15-1 TaxID=2919918 RepID=UPI001F4FBFE4|nr:S8/S53 family peptidase [Pontibacter sp. E15-1]MCJ8165312.1 S8 family peptidase [Pontibacter sp. E15-1]
MKLILSCFTVLCLFANTVFAQVVIDTDLQQQLHTATGPLGVIVTFKGDGAPTTANLTLLKDLGINKGVTFSSLPIAGVLATPAQIESLSGNPAVLSIFLNKQLTYYNYNGTSLTGVKRVRADKGMTARNNGMPVSGKGIGVMINDSGVDGTHDDLKLGTHLVQNVLGTTNLNGVDAMLPVTYLENVPNTDTNSGHGTHCAGSVGGNGARSSGLYEGAAPGAQLIGYGSGGALFILDAIGGYDYALTHQYEYGIRVISNSWGTSGTFEPANPVNIASKKAYDRGIVSLFAAGNDGPSSDTHNPYAIAPWVISVGAGDKYGRLAGFSSRGVKNEGGTFTIDGETWKYENRPTIVAPGVDIVSTRVIAPVSSLGAQKDADLAPAHVPFYTHMSGTSMATPHTAGIVALLLEANPSLSPAQVKDILQKTATNMPNRESWEVGAGYVNAYAAVDHIYRNATFGTSLNMTRSFNSNINTATVKESFVIDYKPVLTADNSKTFNVAQGTTAIEAKITAEGELGLTGNPVNLILTGPDGKEYRAGIPVTFAISTDRGVAVASPMAGTWTLRVEGLNGVALAERVSGTFTAVQLSGSTGLNDIAGHPAEASIKMAVSSRLADGLGSGFKPDELLKRIQLADYLMMGQAVRQYYPTTGAVSFKDVTGSELLLAESVTGKGAALRDRFQTANGIMLTDGSTKFNPKGSVDRTSLAYALVQSLGLQDIALQRNGKGVTVRVDGKDIPVDDAKSIPAGLEGYVSVALDLGLINAFYSVAQGPYDLVPVLHATFKPTQNVTRAEFAVIITRTYDSWNSLKQPLATSGTSGMQAAGGQWTKNFTYPNPFTDATTISYAVEQDGFVTVEVFDVLGKKVNTLVAEQKATGTHEVQFNATNLPAGTYLYRISSGNKTYSNRMMLTR